ncbi:MAG: AsmA family protein [Phaeodactylibacter sp.]|uniref:AsmA family protein n=1 Tax=Phaeodactylibacter sp. TaxID=1940289 RepID=UPI0032EE0F75
MKKIMKRLLIILSITFVLLIGAVAVIAGFFEERIGRTLTRAINQQLTAELSVQGFDLTLFRSFPNLSADLKGVLLEDVAGDPLLKAETVGFRFGLFSLFKSSLEIESVVVEQGTLRILIDKKGRANYDIFKAGPEQEESSASTKINLTKASLKQVSIEYTDLMQDQQVKAMVETAAFSGAFSNTAFELESTAQIRSEFVNLDGVRYLPEKTLAYEISLSVNLDAGTYELQRGALEVEGNAFQVDGTVESWKTGTYFDLFATAKDGNLAGVLALLPATYARQLEGFSSKGRFAFDAIVKGQYNAQQQPEVRVEFGLEEGTLQSSLLEKPLKDVSLQAVFTNGKYRNSQSSVFRLDQFKAYFNRELIELTAEVLNFDDPEVKFYLDGVLPLESAYGLLGKPNITDGSGEVEFKGVRIEGRYQDIINPSRITRVAASGTLEFDDAGLVIGEEELILDRGTLLLEGNRLSIEGLRLEGAGSDLTFEGVAFNLLPVLFADSANSSRAQLEFDARLLGRNLDIDRLMNAVALTASTGSEPALSQDSLAHQERQALFFGFLNGTFDANIEALNYQKMEGQDFQGKLTFRSNAMKVLGEIAAFGGQVNLDGDVAFETAPKLTARLVCESIDVSTLFRQAENFGQEVLTDRHLNGQLEAKVAIYAYWDEKGAFLMDRLRVLSGVAISDGTLQKLEMLEDFSDFVHIGDLREINFVDMQNFLEIRNRRLYLPVMFIRSNALNLTISGEHSFDNEVAYYLKVNAGQVLADRFRRHDPGLRPKPARRSGFFNLYYAMLGTLEDYNITSAKKRVQEDFERSTFRKREIQRALEQEFGIVEFIEEPEDWKDIPEYEHDTYDPKDEEYLDFEVGGR